jgi:serine/threonine-protein kinase RsbW
MPTSRHSQRFPATMSAFEDASVTLRRVFDDCGVHGASRYRAELVFEEIVSNVIRHGHGDGRAHHIDVAFECTDEELVLTFEDDGPAFDPRQHPDPVRPISIEDTPIGGLGIFLVRKSAARLYYERTPDQKNRLIVAIATTDV